MENRENISLNKKKPSYACLAAFGLSVVGVLLSAICFFAGVGALLIPSTVVVTVGVLLALWATDVADKKDESFVWFGISSFFVSAVGVVLTVLAFCF